MYSNINDDTLACVDKYMRMVFLIYYIIFSLNVSAKLLFFGASL